MSTKRKQNKPNRHPEDDNKADTEGQQIPATAAAMSSTKQDSSRDEDKTQICTVKPSFGLVEKETEGLVGKLEDGGGDDDDDNAMISEDEGEDEELVGEDAGGNEDNGETFEPQELPRYEDVDEPPLLEEDHPAKVHSREGSPEKDSDDSPELEKESLTAALQNLMVDFHWPEGTSITIERVESTKIAVAELTAAAIQSSTNDYSSASLQDLALIQSTLFTLQQQQIVQLQLVQQLLAQLAMCTGELESMQEGSEPSSPTHRDHESSRNRERSKSVEKSRENKSTAGETTLSMKFASLLNCGNQDPNRPLSPGLAAQSSLNAILMPDGCLNEEVNTLEMLQKRAQEVLDSASQGLLASSLADDNYRKSGGVMDKREPFFKHRCRYCGKVFGSDSALQIHIRSHTGERPYKCNICGSRFTTKGNLKVHFQRHTAKFPHVKMNPHPVPEHLDHFHPPLLASGERSPDLIPTNLPFGPVPQTFQPMNFMRFDGPAAAAVAAAKLSLGLQLPRPQSIEPEDLSKGKPKKKVEEAAKSDIEDRKFDDEEVDEDEDDDDVEMEKAEQPENLSSKSATLMHSIPLQASPRPARPPSTTSKASRPRRESPSPSSKDGGERMDDTAGLIDITKDPRSYAALLPRPGSASSAWESLIEVNTSSETSKLQQLVDNIDNQISDPNECVVCHRVLSCKSALQMHYRTHTGERPFKCRLCGRAFTTKGNLKTHMGVHRIKEGDTHHQCPVCHKRFTTQLVLQQHIRLHTGEPTELTFDQIRAGEIRDFIPNFAGPAGGGFPLVPTPRESRDSTATPGTPSFSTSLAALENQVRTFTTTFAGSGPPLYPEDLSKKIASGPPTPSVLHPPPSTTSRNSVPSPATTDSELSSSDWGKHSESDTRTTPPSASTPSGQGPPPPFLPLDLTPKNASSLFSPFLPNPLNPLMGNSALSSLASSVLNSTAAFNPMHMSVIAGRGATRGNTTCGLCFKTFACNSALEIHYRSHTKERPFKCTVCDRGFSTKGNMKQHMLTHKIRDMPPNVFDGSKVQNQNSNSSSGSISVPPTPKSNEEPPQKPEIPKEIEREPELRRKIEHIDEPVDEPRHSGHHHDDDNSRSSSSGGSKHMCHVCQKGFSSSSSVHIHMRTHTGDKPFKCNVCQKAFTTKGNLKVHMGTHMWTSGASRRGRRMSLELPLGLQFQPPGIGERVDGRNFFPFVPPNFPGGPVNLAASKVMLVDYSLLRPPMQFTGGIMPGRSSPSVGGMQPKHDDKDDPVTDGGDEDDDALSEA